MKYAASILFIFLSLSSLDSCAGNNEKPHNTAHVQDQSVLVKIQRFDNDFYNYLKKPSVEQYDYMKRQYPQFLKAFSVVAANIKDNEFENQELFKERMTSYFSNKTLAQIYDNELTEFSDVHLYEEELSNANKLINSYFKGKELPELSIHVSGFKANTIVLDNIISISADKYLGENYPVYNQFFEPYQIVQMKPKYIVRDFLKAWLISELKESNKRKNLLTEALYQGKILYALKQLLPDWNEADILGYTNEQEEWCVGHSKEIWKKTIEFNYLFSNDFLIIQKYMDEAPYTATISTNSPGRVGAWLGLQIIKEYAKNADQNLQSILAEKDNQQILKGAKYNP